MTKKSAIILIALVITALTSLTASAAWFVGPTSQTSQVTVQVNPGNLELWPNGDASLNAVTLNGSDTATTGTVGVMKVKDARGTGVGWYLNLSATDFAYGTTDTIPVSGGNYAITGGSVTVESGNGNVAFGTGNLDATGTKVMDAGPVNSGKGRGINSTNPTVSLNVPADAYAGTYESTLTQTLLSYP